MHLPFLPYFHEQMQGQIQTGNLTARAYKITGRRSVLFMCLLGACAFFLLHLHGQTVTILLINLG